MKKLKALFIFFLGVLAIQSFSQTVHWAKKGIGSSRDEGLAVSADPSGNAFTIGGFSSPTITFGSFTLTNSTSSGNAYDVCVVKYDPSGNVLWARSAGGSGQDFGYSVSADVSGNVYATGYFTSPTITFGGFTLTTSKGSIFIVKYDPSGNVLWAKSAGGSGFIGDNGYGVGADVSGNVFVTGYFYSPTITFGSFTLTSAGFDDIFIVKYDPNGNVLWAKSAGGSNSDQGFSVSTDASGNVYATGYFSGPTITFGGFTLTSTGNYDVFIVKYDPGGNVLWAKSAGGTAADRGYSVSTDVSGNVYATGSFASPTATFGSFTLTNAGNNDVYIVKYDPNGNVLWAKSAGGSNEDDGFSISTDYCNHFYVTGSFLSTSITFPPLTLAKPSSPIDPMFLVKFDSNGNALCGSAFASGGDDQNGVCADKFGNAYFTGDFMSSPFALGSTSLTLSGIENIFVAKYSCANTFSTTATAASCTSNNGTASANASGGCAPYTYVWSNGQSTSAISGLAPGTYTITITDACSNCYSPAAVTIGTAPSFTLAPAQTNVVCSTLGSATVTLSGGATPYTYLWNSSPPQTAQTATGLSAGNYSVTVTDANGCSQTQTFTITPSGTVTATAGPASTICAGQVVTLNSSGGNNYSWSNGSTDTEISVAPTITTTYSVVVSTGSCADTAYATVVVGNMPPPVITGNTSLCQGDIATLTASGGASYLWNTGETTSVITANVTTLTSYTITATNASGCTGTATVDVTVSAPPVAAVNSVTICSGETATLNASGGGNYLWSNGNTTSAIIISPAGNSTYSVIVSVGSCADTAYSSVAVNPSPSVTISGNTFLCKGEGTTLAASGGNNYTWSTAETTAIINASPTITTSYTVTTTSVNGCSASSAITVTVSPIPVANALPSTICAGQNTTITATGGGTYLWSTGETTNPIIVSPPASTNYSVIVSAGSCKDTANTTVQVNPVPIATVWNDTVIMVGTSATLSASGGGSYLWSDGATDSVIIVSPAVATIYCVTVDNGSCSDSACVTVLVEPINCAPVSSEDAFVLPSAFSPNKDGQNDQWRLLYAPLLVDCITEFQVMVYSRWGEKVFEGTDINFSWDGTYKGTMEATAVFGYYLTATTKDGTKIKKKGNISLLR